MALNGNPAGQESKDREQPAGEKRGGRVMDLARNGTQSMYGGELLAVPIGGFLTQNMQSCQMSSLILTQLLLAIQL